MGSAPCALLAASVSPWDLAFPEDLDKARQATKKLQETLAQTFLEERFDVTFEEGGLRARERVKLASDICGDAAVAATGVIATVTVILTALIAGAFVCPMIESV